MLYSSKIANVLDACTVTVLLIMYIENENAAICQGTYIQFMSEETLTPNITIRIDVRACEYTYIYECGSAHSRVCLTTVSVDPTGVWNLYAA